LQILENSGRYWDTSIYQYLYQYCRYWKILLYPLYMAFDNSGVQYVPVMALFSSLQVHGVCCSKSAQVRQSRNFNLPLDLYGSTGWYYPLGCKILTWAIPKYWSKFLKFAVIISGCPMGYLQYLLT
jgi:hypothetical protein